MYVPAHFEENRIEVLHALINEHPLAAMVTLNSSTLTANHIPMELDREQGEYGLLRGHVARGNPVWRDYSEEHGALAVFQGPQRYITPNWYQTKGENGKVVPTWNYAVVHASGPLRIIEDREWLLALVSRLTDRHESESPMPWKVTDAPADYIDKLLGAIVGIEIPIVKLTGKWKVSQNRSAEDRAQVASSLRQQNDAQSSQMARLVSDSGD